MLVSVASFLPIIVVGPISDLFGTTAVLLVVAVAVGATGVASVFLRGPSRREPHDRAVSPQYAAAVDPIGVALSADFDRHEHRHAHEPADAPSPSADPTAVVSTSDAGTPVVEHAHEHEHAHGGTLDGGSAVPAHGAAAADADPPEHPDHRHPSEGQAR
jgi:hypothetical protein